MYMKVKQGTIQKSAPRKLLKKELMKILSPENY